MLIFLESESLAYALWGRVSALIWLRVYNLILVTIVYSLRDRLNTCQSSAGNIKHKRELLYILDVIICNADGLFKWNFIALICTGCLYQENLIDPLGCALCDYRWVIIDTICKHVIYKPASREGVVILQYQ